MLQADIEFLKVQAGYQDQEVLVISKGFIEFLKQKYKNYGN
jgi:hypothetical protein